MNVDSIRTDLAYAIKQLKYANGKSHAYLEDAKRRCLDALERIEAELADDSERLHQAQLDSEFEDLASRE